MATLNENISQAIRDFDSIKQAIIEKGVDVPIGTPTSEYSEKILEIETGITPTGTIEITENGEQIDISQYALANVNVPQPMPSGTIEITSNGTHDVSDYAEADVNVVDYALAELVTGAVTHISIPDQADRIRKYCFHSCDKLKSVQFSNNLTYIDDYAFAGCSALDNVVLPQSVTTVNASAFQNCTSLENIELSDNLIYLSSDTFQNTAWYNSQPEGIIYLDNCVYGYKGTMPTGTNIVILSGTKLIASNAFSNQRGLSSIILPDTLISICYGAFNGCSNITSIDIPSSVTHIGLGLFSGCDNLTRISVNEENNIYDSREDCNAIIETESNELILGCAVSTIPNSVTSIGHNAFSSTNITNITIPDSVTSIGESAFSWCDGLLRIDIPNSVTSIGKKAFHVCFSLATVNLSNSIQIIDYLTFSNCHNIESISIPNSVLIIGEMAFSSCGRLAEVIIPTSVESIGNFAFDHCSSIANVYYAGTEEEWNQITVGTGNNYLLNATIHYNYTP